MSRRIIVACVCWVFVLAAFVMAGCSPEQRAAPDAGTVGVVSAGVQRDALRIRNDAARSRTWLLGLEAVRVYDTASGKLIREIVLPGWSVARLVCNPDLVLDGSGSAFVSSNGQARLWRIDGNSFELSMREVRMIERERWDIGFGALAFSADGTLVALTSLGGSLWKIDVGTGDARMVEQNPRLLNVCDFTAQLLNDVERSKP